MWGAEKQEVEVPTDNNRKKLSTETQEKTKGRDWRDSNTC